MLTVPDDSSFLYRNATSGALLTSGPDRGSMLLYTPLLYPSESSLYDFALREECCDGPGLCDLFFTRRPSQECSQYDPMTWGKGYKITYVLITCLLLCSMGIWRSTLQKY